MRASDPRLRFRQDGMEAISPERLVVLLYQRLLRDLDEAAAAMDVGDRELVHHSLLHAQMIVEELSYAVRPEVWDGGGNLLALYEFVLDRLVVANVQKSPAALAEARDVVSGLCTAWDEAYSSLHLAAGDVA